MSLWNLSEELQRVDEAIDRHEGEDIPVELVAIFDQLETELDDRHEQFAWLMRKLTAESAMLKEQSKRFGDESKRLGNIVDRMKAQMKTAMEATGKKKLGAFSVCKTGGKNPLVIDGEVPEEFIKYEPSQDKEKIRQYLESGGELDFAKIGERGTHVRLNLKG